MAKGEGLPPGGEDDKGSLSTAQGAEFAGLLEEPRSTFREKNLPSICSLDHLL